MRTRVCIVLLLTLCLGAAAQAATDRVFCWNTNFDDTLHIWALSATGDDTMFALPSVHWHGLTVYQMDGSSSTRLSESTPNVIRVSLVMDNASSFFGNNPSCKLRVTLQTPSLDGSWTITCTGGVSPFLVNGTMTLAACPSDPSTEIARAMAPQRGLAGESSPGK